MANRHKVSHAAIRKALPGSAGIRSVIAKRLGVERTTLYKYLAKNPDLQQEVDEEIENLIDVAETKLSNAVNNGEQWAVNKVLNRPAALRRSNWKLPTQRVEQEVVSFNLDVPFDKEEIKELLEGD